MSVMASRLFVQQLVQTNSTILSKLRIIHPLCRDAIGDCAFHSQRERECWEEHYNDVIMSAIASQITNLAIVYSTVYSGADQRKHQSSASLVFVRGIHRWPVDSPHKGPVTRKIFPFDDALMKVLCHVMTSHVLRIHSLSETCVLGLLLLIT